MGVCGVEFRCIEKYMWEPHSSLVFSKDVTLAETTKDCRKSIYRIAFPRLSGSNRLVPPTCQLCTCKINPDSPK